MDWFDALKTIGSITGLLAFGFTVYDRLVAHRPRVTWCKVDETIGVSIENLARENILIEDVLVHPEGCSVAFSGDLRDTIEAAARAIKPEDDGTEQITFLLSTGAAKVLHVVCRDGMSDPPEHLRVTVVWRLCRSRWLSQPPIQLSADKAFLLSLKNARTVP
jgi:hypothetical protein